MSSEIQRFLDRRANEIIGNAIKNGWTVFEMLRTSVSAQFVERGQIKQ